MCGQNQNASLSLSLSLSLLSLYIYIYMHASIHQWARSSFRPSAWSSVGPASHSSISLGTLILTSFHASPTYTHLSNVFFFLLLLFSSIYVRPTSGITFQCSGNFISRPNQQSNTCPNESVNWAKRRIWERNESGAQ